jgi:hypothetical protein
MFKHVADNVAGPRRHRALRLRHSVQRLEANREGALLVGRHGTKHTLTPFAQINRTGITIHEMRATESDLHSRNWKERICRTKSSPIAQFGNEYVPVCKQDTGVFSTLVFVRN